MTSQRVNVTVDDEHVATIEDVVDQLRERGMSVDRVLVNLGIVTGTAENVDALRDVAGILAVDNEGRMGVAPPGHEIQ